MNKSVYLGLSILDLIKTVMYEFWFEYVKLKYSKDKTVLYGYKQFHCIQKNRRYL